MYGAHAGSPTPTCDYMFVATLMKQPEHVNPDKMVGTLGQRQLFSDGPDQELGQISLTDSHVGTHSTGGTTRSRAFLDGQQ